MKLMSNAAVCALAMLSSAQVLSAGPPRPVGLYRIDPAPGWQTSTTDYVSDDGQVFAGASRTSSNSVGTRWSPSGPPDVFNGSFTFARGLNSDGNVLVGENSGGSFRWTPSGGFTFLPALPGGGATSLRGVSSDGVYSVGLAFINSTGRAVRWSLNGPAQVLGVLPGGTHSSAHAVNDDGSRIVGSSGSSFGERAFLWTPSGGMRSLGTFTGNGNSSANSISRDGTTVVGYAAATQNVRAFRWTQSGGLQSLGALPGDTISEALDVTDDGSMIIGTSSDGGAAHPFVWTQAGGMISLGSYLSTHQIDTTGWSLLSPTSISGDGHVIVGTGRYQGQVRGWAAVVPAPGSGCLLLVCLRAMSRRRRLME